MNWVTSASSSLSNSAVVHARLTPSVVGVARFIGTRRPLSLAVLRFDHEMGEGTSYGVDDHAVSAPRPGPSLEETSLPIVNSVGSLMG